MGGAIWQYVLVNVMGFLTHYGHVAGGAVSKVNPDSTGVNPAWRNALSIGWNEGTSASEINQMRPGLALALGNLSRLAGSSAYLNEVRLLALQA
jgi:hypothetical protein